MGETKKRSLEFRIFDISFSNACYEDAIVQTVDVINRLTKCNIVVNSRKVVLAKPTIILLGHVLTRTGITMDPNKQKAIADWPHPSSGKAMMRFLGAANYYRQYVKHYALITAPLDNLRKAGTIDWKNNTAAKKAFIKIKEEMSKQIMLKVADPALGIFVGTDASDAGVGGWLGQRKPEFGHVPDADIAEDHLDFIH